MKLHYKAVFAAFLIFSLQACTVEESGTQTSSVDASNECRDSGGSFCDVGKNGVELELLINTTSPLVLPEHSGGCDDNPLSNEYCFEIAGTCNEAGLESADIVARAFGESQTLGTCQRGRFQVLYRRAFAPPGTPSSPTTATLCDQHTLELELIGKPIGGGEIINVGKARKPITISVSNHESCPR
jgi:hypothetical protein